MPGLHTHTHTHARACLASTHTHACMHTQRHAWPTHTHIHTCRHAWPTHTHRDMPGLHTHTHTHADTPGLHTHVHTRTHTRLASRGSRAGSLTAPRGQLWAGLTCLPPLRAARRPACALPGWGAGDFRAFPPERWLQDHHQGLSTGQGGCAPPHGPGLTRGLQTPCGRAALVPGTSVLLGPDTGLGLSGRSLT